MSPKIIFIGRHRESTAIRSSCLLAIELKKAGFNVKFGCIYSPSDKLCKFLIQNNIDYEVIETPIQEEEINRINPIKKKITKNKSRLSQIEVKLKFLQEQQLLSKVEAYLKKANPNLIIIEQMTGIWALPFIKSEIPIIGTNITLANSFSFFYPPVFSSYVPRKNVFINVLVNCYLWLTKVYLNRLNYLIHSKFEEIIKYGLIKVPKTNYYSEIKKYGYKSEIYEYGIKINVPELVYCPIQLEFNSNGQSKDRCYVGSILYELNEDLDFKLDKTKKIIFCTLGHYSFELEKKIRDNFYSAITLIAERRNDIQFILQTHDPYIIEKYKDCNNVIISKWVNPGKILPYTSLLIHHGGIGLTMDAIYNAIPSIVFPWNADQPGNAARIVFHNLGIKLNIKKIQANKLEKHIDKVLNDTNIKSSLIEIQRRVQKQNNYSHVIDFINRQLK